MAPTTREPAACMRQTLLTQVKQLADDGDRWFTAIAGRFLMVGSWARRKAGAAAATLTGTNRSRGRDAQRPRMPQRASRKSSGAKRTSYAAAPSAASNGTPAGVGLLRATTDRPDDRCGTAHLGAGAQDEPVADKEGSPAGVVPLVQAMGHVVAEHAAAAYATLAHDDRLWTLIDLVQVLSNSEAARRATAQRSSGAVGDEAPAEGSTVRAPQLSRLWSPKDEHPGNVAPNVREAAAVAQVTGRSGARQ